MSVRHQKCGVYLLDKNHEWQYQEYPNDLAADAAVHQAFTEGTHLYAFEDFNASEDFFVAIEQAARDGKSWKQIDDEVNG